MLFIDSPRPTSGEYMAQRLRFPDSFEWVTQDFIEQSIQSLQHGPVLTLPEAVVVPPVRGEYQSH